MFCLFEKKKTEKAKNIFFYPLHTGGSLMCTLANSEDPDEMLHNAAFHQGLYYLLRQKTYSEKEKQFLFGNYNLRPFDMYNGPSKGYCIKPEGIIH